MDERDKIPEGVARESQSPGGEGFPTHPDQPERERGRNASGEEAEAAADRALSDEPVTRAEIIEQSGYTGQEADAGERAADAERADGEGEPAADPSPYPNNKP